jgi:hypothetical protein
LGLIETHHLLVYSDNVNILGKNINIIKKNKEVPLDANKKFGLEENTQRTKYMFMFLAPNCMTESQFNDS